MNRYTPSSVYNVHGNNKLPDDCNIFLSIFEVILVTLYETFVLPSEVILTLLILSFKESKLS